jgi:hypothetical protein
MVQIDKSRWTLPTTTIQDRRLNPDNENGAHDRSRTGDLTLTKGVLYQLSYMGNHKRHSTQMERVMGIEPTPSAWKAEVLPLNYTRSAFTPNDGVPTGPPTARRTQTRLIPELSNGRRGQWVTESRSPARPTDLVRKDIYAA